MRVTRSTATENDDLPLQIDTELPMDGVVRDGHQLEDIGSCRVVDVDDEVRVFRGDLSTAGSAPLESGGFDEPSSPVTGRILEDASETADPVWLRRFALRLYRIGAFANAARVVGVHAQTRADDHIAGKTILEAGVAVAEVTLRSRERNGLPHRIQRGAVDQHVRHLRPERAGVAEHACAARARHA